MAQARECGGKLQRKKDQEPLRQQLNAAYNQDTYEEAKAVLTSICEAFITDRRTIAGGPKPDRGIEETLTLHRLGVGKQLRRSLRTTNIMEHLNSRINESLRRIKHWVHSDQCHRWVAMALNETESRLKPLKHIDQLRALQGTLLEHAQQRQ